MPRASALVATGLCVLLVLDGVVPVAYGSSRTTDANPKSCTASQIVSRWPNVRLVEQLLAIPVDEHSLSVAREEVAAGAGGIVLTGTPPSNLALSIANLSHSAQPGVPPIVMTDEEGGEVQRLLPLVADVPTARSMGRLLTSAEIASLATRLARSMRNLGVGMDLAPVADVDARPGPSPTNADGTRSFSGVVNIVSTDALAFARGLAQGGVVPVIKHFPGLGGATGNTDLAAAQTLPWTTLVHNGLVPFVRAIAAGVPAIMVSNATIPGLSRLPASLSRVVITGELRGRLHFHGLIMTDSLTTIAITSAGYSLPQAVVAALVAGADMVLFNARDDVLGAISSKIVASVLAALVARKITRALLLRDAALVLATKGIGPCQTG